MIAIEKKIIDVLKKSLGEVSLSVGDILLEHPADISHGDYSTNIAMVLAKESKQNPKELAEKIVEEINKNTSEEIEKVEMAGPGFINFYLSRAFFVESVATILKEGKEWGSNDLLKDKKIMVEYTDPNPFKEFHIGHLMSNAIGESISRMIAFSGAEVKRANYQGDVGLHVAKALWGVQKQGGEITDVKNLGEAYVSGAEAYEADAKEEIHDINKKIYDKSDDKINSLYEAGRKISLDHFEELYKKLGTQFDYYFFESETGPLGRKLIEEHPEVFEKSDGAVVFKGEKYGLHTRVFLSSEGLPTYEAKELGLALLKKEKFDADQSIYITASEQNEYFKVVIKAIETIDKSVAEKIVHVGHGMLRLPGGKMSSRKGGVISGESLLSEVEVKIETVMEESSIENKKEVAEDVAVGAIKYSILKQSSGKDIIFDFDASLSFEGNSGPYLQYSNARALSLLEKSSKKVDTKNSTSEATLLEKLLYRFPAVVERAVTEFQPHYVTHYLTDVAGAFNSFYGNEKIIGGENEGYKLALTKAFTVTMQNGLALLGVKTPERM